MQEEIVVTTEEGERIVITIAEIGRTWVKLGFDAPDGVGIGRDTRKLSKGE
jgi:sRNA-binding carbon storage regulator CsrA